MPGYAMDDCEPKIKVAPELAGGHNLTHKQLMACVDVGKALTAELDPDKLIATIMEKVSILLPSETWSLFRLDEQAQELKFEISVDLDPETVKDVRLAMGQGVAGQAALQQRLLVVEDVNQCDYFYSAVDKASGRHTESLICVPIVYGGRTLGVLEVVNPKTIDKTGLSLLNLLADYLAIAIENTRRYKLMQDMAVRDNLTGLYNQRYLYQGLKKAIAACQTTGRPLSLIFMDMDDFKEVVDKVGHLNGSRALSEVAQRIKQCLPKPAYGVAYGGDEFVVVLPGFNQQQATDLADEMRKSIKATTYLTRWGHEVKLTASFGVATFPDDANDSTALLSLADQAMFSVKNTGKDGVN